MSDPLHAALRAGDVVSARRSLAEADPAELLDQLARHAADGNRLATELLVEQLDASGVVRRFVAGVLLDESAVDDVSQDTLISVATSIRSFTGGSKVTTWVHRIARNRVVDHLRRQRPTTELGEEALSLAERMSSVIATRATISDLLAGLPEHYRETVTLRDVEGLSYGEIASRLGRSVGTVKSQVARGRALAAAALEGDR